MTHDDTPRKLVPEDRFSTFVPSNPGVDAMVGVGLGPQELVIFTPTSSLYLRSGKAF